MNKIKCPHCGSEEYGPEETVEDSIYMVDKYICDECNEKFNVLYEATLVSKGWDVDVMKDGKRLLIRDRS